MSHYVVISQHTDTVYSKREVMPTKRTRKVAWYIVCFLATVGIIIYGFRNDMETKFYPTSDLYAAITQNKTRTYYQRTEKKTYPVFFSLGLGLLGVLLAPVIRCVCDLVDELRQFQSCYKGDLFKLSKACFSGISWKSVIAVAIVDGIALLIRQTFSLNDVMVILGGIGVGPLVTILLELNAPSAVDRSRQSEKEKSTLPYVLAWIYHFHFLQDTLSAFAKRFPDSNLTVRLDEGQRLDECSDQVQLHLKKLILLFSANFKKGVELPELDDHIRKITDVHEGKYKFPIYGLKYKENEYNFVILYAEEYTEIIKEMSKSEACKAVHPGQVEEQVMFMFATVNEYLKMDGHPCKCIPVLVSAAEGFENGGLVKQIMIMFSVPKFVTEPVTEEESPAVTGPTFSMNHTVDVDSANENSSLLQNRSRSTEDSRKSQLSRYEKPAAPFYAEPDESAFPLTGPTTPMNHTEDVDSDNENSSFFENRSQSTKYGSKLLSSRRTRTWAGGRRVKTNELSLPKTAPTMPIMRKRHISELSEIFPRKKEPWV